MTLGQSGVKEKYLECETNFVRLLAYSKHVGKKCIFLDTPHFMLVYCLLNIKIKGIILEHLAVVLQYYKDFNIL